MKRMGALLGLTSLIVLSFAYFIGTKFSLCISALAVVLFVLSFVLKKYRSNKYIKVVLGIVIVASLYFSIFTTYYYKPIVYNNSYKEINISARVMDSPYQNYNQFYYPVKIYEIDSKDESIKAVLISQENLNANLDDVITTTTSLQVASGDYYKSKGFYLKGKIDEDTKFSVSKLDSHSIRYYPYKLREMLVTEIDEYMDSDNSGICSAIAFGEKNYLTQKTKDDFKKAGMSHLLVVSGLHTSVIAMIFLFVFQKIFPKKYIHCSLTILLILFYMIMTGLSFSVIRSSVMVIIMLLGKMISRQSDSLNSLGISALVILIFNPYSAGDVGLLLSFASTLGIVVFSKGISDYINQKLKFSNRIIKYITNIILISLSACLFSAPILLIFFKRISLVQLLSNLLISPVFELLLIIVIVGAFLSLTGIAVLYAPFLYVANILASYIHFVAKLTTKIPFSYVSTNRKFVYVFLTMCFVMAGVVFLLKNYNKVIPLVSGVMIIVLLVGTISNYYVNYFTPKINVYDTGDGVTLSLHYKGKSIILSSGGSSYSNPLDSLLDNSNYYDFYSITDKYYNRSGYTQEILNEFDLNTILLYDVVDKSDYEDCENYKNISTFKNDKTVKIGDITVKYLVRKGNVFIYVTVNDKSVLVLPSYGDCKYLEEQYCSPTITVTDKSQVYNTNLINTNLLVLCCTEDNYAKAINNNQINSKRLYTTYNGDFSSKIEVW